MRGLRVFVAFGVVGLFMLSPASSLSVSSTNTFSIEETGAAGDWLFLYEPFDEPRDSVRFSFDVEVEATGGSEPATGLFTSRPWLVIDWGDGPELWPQHVFKETGPLYVDREGDSVGFSANERWSAGIGGGVFVGVFFVLGSNVPWTADVTVSIEDEPAGDGTPALLSRGGGTVLVPQGDRGETLTPDGALVGTMDLDAAIATAGWTHLQYEYRSIQPIGFREYDIMFPNGFGLQGEGRMTGVETPTLGSASSSNWYDYAGTVLGTAGNLTSSLTYTQAAYRLDAALIHMPITAAGLPSGLTGADYADSNWPFQGLSTPTSGGDGQWLHPERLA